jgi:hypothetical protein
MKFCTQWLCACVFLGVVSCADRLSPARAASSDANGSAGPVLQEGAAGRITAGHGTAVAGATVLAVPLDGAAVPEMAIVSDDAGRYEWPLRPGRHELSVVADGYQRVSKSVRVTAGVVATLDFLLSRNR